MFTPKDSVHLCDECQVLSASRIVKRIVTANYMWLLICKVKAYIEHLVIYIHIATSTCWYSYFSIRLQISHSFWRDISIKQKANHFLGGGGGGFFTSLQFVALWKLLYGWQLSFKSNNDCQSFQWKQYIGVLYP